MVGHSLGALIALQAAVDRPDIVQSLVLIEPAPAGIVADKKVEDEVVDTGRLTAELRQQIKIWTARIVKSYNFAIDNRPLG